uniref:hypothetical protein n=1 Tax=Geminicoccus harenae TaxID=2498453 RepID=UPI001C973239
ITLNTMEVLKLTLNLFIARMREEDKKVFARFGLASWFSLCHVKLEDKLLNAVVHFWDSDLHVFRFNREEVCPLFEEFCALMNVSARGLFVFPTLRRGYFHTLSSLFELSPMEASTFISENSIDLLKLASFFLREGGSSLALHRPTQYALALCIIGCFLVSNGTTSIPIETCELILPLSESHNIIPLVLAETLNGLDY